MSIMHKLQLVVLGTLIVSVMTGCASPLWQFQPKISSPDEFRSMVDRIQPGDVVDITDLNNHSYTLKITGKGETYLEGHASDPGPQPWLSRHEFAKMKWLDGVVVPAGFVYDPEAEIADAITVIDEPSAPVAAPEEVLPTVIPPVATTPLPAAEPDPAYAVVTANLRKGEMIDVIPLSGNRFRIELTEVGLDYVKGVRFEDSGVGGQAPPQRYEIREFKSINGAAVPYDLGQFKVGDRVEFKTVAGETRRFSITEISRDDVTGIPLSDESGQEPIAPVYLRREEIASGKIYLTGGEKAEKVGKVIATGIKTLAVIVLAVGVLFVMLIFEFAASPGVQYI